MKTQLSVRYVLFLAGSHWGKSGFRDEKLGLV